MELITKALSNLLAAQPVLLEMVPIMGHIQGFVKNLTSSSKQVSKSSLIILRHLSNNKQCSISMMNQSLTLKNIMAAIEMDPEMTGVACETLNKLFQLEMDSFVQQAIESQLITFLLRLLDAGPSSLPSSTKAIIVLVLKSMESNETYGEQIQEMLNKSSVWSEFRDQKHDLFISNQGAPMYLTCKSTRFSSKMSSNHLFVCDSAGANIAGYLTQGPSMQNSSSPPPIDDY